MCRVNAYIDGFNLYYAIKYLNNPNFKWLDLRKMCSCFLKAEYTLNDVYYFSAYTNFYPRKRAKHQLYTQALEQSSKTKVILGKFKKKKPKCGKCNQQNAENVTSNMIPTKRKKVMSI